MDLRSGLAYWPQVNGDFAEFEPISRSAQCEVVVLGGGITGALSAYFLADAGIDTILLEKRRIGAGSTAASSALLQYELDVHLSTLTERMGAARGARSYRLGWESIRALPDLLTSVGDDCGFRLKSSLYLASRQDDVPELRVEHRARRNAGFDVEFLEQRDIESEFGFSAPAALMSQGDAQIDAFRFAHRLVEWAAKRGTSVHERTEAVRCEPQAHGVRLWTSTGATIDACRILFATGYESEGYLGLDRRLGDLNTTFAVVTDPIPDPAAWLDRYVLWETARPYFYLRSVPQGRALLGGEDDARPLAHQDTGLVAAKASRLLQRFQALVPAHSPAAACAWAGTFGESRDGLAYIGPAREFPHALFALGYGGNGITYAVMAAQINADFCRGRHNADAELFRLDR